MSEGVSRVSLGGIKWKNLLVRIHIHRALIVSPRFWKCVFKIYKSTNHHFVYAIVKSTTWGHQWSTLSKKVSPHISKNAFYKARRDLFLASVYCYTLRKSSWKTLLFILSQTKKILLKSYKLDLTRVRSLISGLSQKYHRRSDKNTTHAY